MPHLEELVVDDKKFACRHEGIDLRLQALQR